MKKKYNVICTGIDLIAIASFHRIIKNYLQMIALKNNKKYYPPRIVKENGAFKYIQSNKIPEPIYPKHECKHCKSTFETISIICPKCGTDINLPTLI